MAESNNKSYLVYIIRIKAIALKTKNKKLSSRNTRCKKTIISKRFFRSRFIIAGKTLRFFGVVKKTVYHYRIKVNKLDN